MRPVWLSLRQPALPRQLLLIVPTSRVIAVFSLKTGRGSVVPFRISPPITLMTARGALPIGLRQPATDHFSPLRLLPGRKQGRPRRLPFRPLRTCLGLSMTLVPPHPLPRSLPVSRGPQKSNGTVLGVPRLGTVPVSPLVLAGCPTNRTFLPRNVWASVPTGPVSPIFRSFPFSVRSRRRTRSSLMRLLP